MAIVKNADGSITVGMIPEAVEEEVKAEVEEPTSAPKKKTTKKK